MLGVVPTLAAMTSSALAPDPTQIVLADPDGEAVRFSDLAADPLVVILVRYFGCLPCQAYVEDVDDAISQFAPEARVVAVGGSADFQAQWLRDTKGVGMPLLLDPDQQVRRLAELGNLHPHQFLSLRGAANYGKALRRGLRPQKVTKDTVRAPGVAIFGPDLGVRWTYAGKKLGDYPSVDELIRRTVA